MPIHILSDDTISKIAAGEVVERPMNVAKELIENSIDAGATAVTCEIRDGGISFLRVSDNGCGIKKDEIVYAFYRQQNRYGGRPAPHIVSRIPQGSAFQYSCRCGCGDDHAL